MPYFPPPSGQSSITVSDSAPGSPSVGSLWWNSLTGILKVYYTDADSSQWVDASPSAAPIATSAVLGVVKISGTPADASNPTVPCIDANNNITVVSATIGQVVTGNILPGPATGIVARATIANAVNAVAFTFDNTTSLSASGTKLASFTNNGTEKFAIDSAGNVAMSGMINDSGWINATLNTGATNAGAPYPNTRYRKIAGVVYVEIAYNSTAADGSTIFTLPAGYRPSGTIGPTGVVDNIQRITVDSSGNVIRNHAVGNPIVATFSFPADA